ncbi:MAG: hypothetical protein V3574_01445 [Candidatus Moraniibacteriota bacterium]
MEPSEKYIKEFQEIYKKEHGKELTWEEAADGARNLLNFVGILYDSYKEDCFRKRKLKDYPKGFHLDDGKTYSCRICREHISNEQTWWDEGGIKCLHCQKALDKKIIPKSVCKDDDSWYATWEFDYYFKIKTPTVRKFVRQGKLKPRIIKNKDTGKPHFELFMIKDNKDVLPNKPESYLVKDEQNRVHVEYKNVDTSKLIGKDNNIIKK